MVVTYQIDDHNQLKEIYQVPVFKFTIGDVSDIDVLKYSLLDKWASSNAGSFILTHSIETPKLHQFHDPLNCNINVTIIAKLEKKHLSEYYLRWPTLGDKND